MPDKKIHIEGISQEIILRRNTRIKRLSIKIDTRSGVVVCVPFSISEERAVQFIQSHKNWILKHLSSEKYRHKEIPNQIALLTCIVYFEEIEHNVSKIQQKKSNWLISIPKSYDFGKKEIYKRELLNKVLRKEAQVFLPKRVAFLAEKYGFEYGKLSLRNQKTRWGSCSYQNNISLNIQLMRFPLHLVDYVIIHELCHTVHKNHSNQFWQLVYKVIGDSLYKCKKEMQRSRIEL